MSFAIPVIDDASDIYIRFARFASVIPVDRFASDYVSDIYVYRMYIHALKICILARVNKEL